MAKKLTYNGPFFKDFLTRIHGTQIRFGLLIGATGEGQRDVILAAPTPPQPSEDGELLPPIKDVLAHFRSKAGANFSQWVQQHSSALHKLLPGGLQVCGCFAIMDEAAAKDFAPVLSAALRGIEDATVLTIDSKTKKLSFWNYSGGAKPALRPAQAKADPQKEAVLLWAAVSLDFALPQQMGGDEAGTTEPEAIADEVRRSVLEDLSNSTCATAVGTANDLRRVDLTKETTLNCVLGKDCAELKVAFLRGGTPLTAAPKLIEQEAATCQRQRCLVTATALFLRRDVELRHAVASLRDAIATSAAERLHLALEEADSEPLMLPWRAHCHPQTIELPLWCGDHVMPDESVEAARERMGQLLGVQETAFDEAPAHLDERAQLQRAHVGTYESGAVGDGRATKSSRVRKANRDTVDHAATTNIRLCIGAVAAILVAVAIPALLR